VWKSKELKRKELFERALSEMLPAAFQVSEKWKLFSNTVVFQDDVPLEEQVRIFSQPLAEFFKKAYPNISKTDPMVYLATLLIGIYLAKTHPIPAVLNVARHLDQDLGVGGIEELVKKFVSGTPNL
jgi:hypothetical protein